MIGWLDSWMAGWLDQYERYAAAEAAYAPGGEINMRKFAAKYKRRMKLGRTYGYRSEGHLIDLFIIGGRIPADVRDRLKVFVSRPEADQLDYTETPPEGLSSEVDDELDLPLEYRSTARAALSNLGLPDNTSYYIFQDQQGHLWFCTAGGLAKFDNIPPKLEVVDAIPQIVKTLITQLVSAKPCGDKDSSFFSSPYSFYMNPQRRLGLEEQRAR
ncbi:MAG: hypothetical protein GY869_08685 [Planctomycetes bacterium]|nr:hypothetical protein [Planctomycetota bacterium]